MKPNIPITRFSKTFRTRLCAVLILVLGEIARAASTEIGGLTNSINYRSSSLTGASLFDERIAPIAPIPQNTRSSARASLGSLGVYVISNGSGSALGQSIAQASARWSDTFTVTADGIFTQPGRLAFDLFINGVLTTWMTNEILNSSSVRVISRYDWAAFPPSGVVAPILSGNGEYTAELHSQLGLTSTRSEVESETISDLIDFYVGGTISFSVSLFAEAKASDFGARHTYTVGAAADFAHSANWGGITSLTDANGVPLTGVSVISPSGVDYTRPIPEPGAGLLVLAGCAVILNRRRTGRS